MFSDILSAAERIHNLHASGCAHAGLTDGSRRIYISRLPYLITDCYLYMIVHIPNITASMVMVAGS